MEILLKKKQLRDAKKLVLKDAVSNIHAGNVPLMKLTEVDSLMKLTETGTDDTGAGAADVMRSRYDKAAQVGIDVNTNHARTILPNLSISIEEAF